MSQARNVLGSPLQVCSVEPLTGFTRDGVCHTGPQDIGSHTVCAQMTEVQRNGSENKEINMEPISQMNILKKEKEITLNLMVYRKASCPWGRKKHKGRRGVPDGTRCI